MTAEEVEKGRKRKLYKKLMKRKEETMEEEEEKEDCGKREWRRLNLWGID